jgi:hypothetical protein
MSVSTGDELIGALSELRTLFPDWRMGQLVANLVTATGGMDAGAIWDVEDEQLLAAARRLIERNRGRAATCAEPNAAPEHGGNR